MIPSSNVLSYKDHSRDVDTTRATCARKCPVAHHHAGAFASPATEGSRSATADINVKWPKRTGTVDLQ